MMNINSNKILYYLLFFHIFLWTIIPSIFNTNLPLDTIEGLVWGNELKLGYDKYPPIFPLFTELFYKLFGNQDWAYYLLSQIFIVSTFFVIYKFSKFFLKNDFYSLISVLLLESIYFFNYTSPELNAFIPLLLFLALTSFYAWRAISFNNNFDWVMLGIFAGISTLTYYLAFYLLASLTIFFIREIIINKRLNNKYFLSLSAYIIVLSPHLYFLMINDFKSIEYALFRSFGDPLSGIGELKFYDHIFYPIIFLIKQLFILAPLILLLRLNISSFKIKVNFNDEKLIFLFTITFLPIILMFLTSMIGGVRIRTMWMTTFYVFPGIFFVYLFSPNIIIERFKIFVTAFLFIFLTLPIVYGADSYIQKDKRTDFPGKIISKKVQTTWDKNFSNKIENIVGKGWVYGRWYGGNLSYHLKDRPKLKEKKLDDSFNEGTIWIDVINNIKSCNGILLKFEPYFESCLVGKRL